MRLADRGPAGVRGGANGRLFVHLHVEPDPRFERHGDDLHHEAHVSFAQAALGASIEVPTLRATTTVDVPTELDDTSRDLLRQLAEHRGESVNEETGGLFSRKRGAKR